MSKAMFRLSVFSWLVLAAVAANEINNVITFKVTKGYLDYTRAVNSAFSITAQTPIMAADTFLVSSNWTYLGVGNVSTNGWAFFRNQSTNGVYCQISVTNDGTAIFSRMESGAFALIQLDPATTLYGRANATSAVSVVIERVVFDR